MITIDIFLALAIFLSVALGVVFFAWIFYNYSKERTKTHAREAVHQCPYCTYVFVNDKEEGIFVCPRCRSYITQDPCGP